MAVTERRRHALHEWAKRVGDEEVAETLMDLLPPVGWADVATKRDLEHLRLQVRADLAEGLRGLEEKLAEGLRGVDQQMRGLEGKLAEGLRGVDGEMRGLEGKLAEGLRGVDGEMRGLEREMRGLERALRLQLYWVVGSIWTALGVALAVLS